MRPDIEKAHREYSEFMGSSADLGVDDRLNFGKHRGKLIGDILEDDPSYLAWVVDENIRAIEFDEEVMQELSSLGY